MGYLCHLAIKRDYGRGLKEWNDLRPLMKVSRVREGWRARATLNASNHRRFVGDEQTPDNPLRATLSLSLSSGHTTLFHSLGVFVNNLPHHKTGPLESTMRPLPYL